MPKILGNTVKIAVLACVLVLAAPGRIDAQARAHPGGHGTRIIISNGSPFWYWPSYGGYGGYYGNPYFSQSSWYSYSYWYSTPGYVVDPLAGWQRMVVNNMLNNPPPAGEARADNAAQIEVSLPAGAELWFDGKKTTQTGGTRHFVTPPLRPGQVFYYELSATWMEYGRPVQQTQRVEVHAGQQVKVLLAQAD